MKTTTAPSAGTGFGQHLTLDGYGCTKESLADMETVRAALDQLPDIVSMTKIAPPIVVKYNGGEKPEDWGYSGFTLIAESHITIHTFPGKGFLTVDIYTCKNFESEGAISYLTEVFGIKDVELEMHHRGLKFKRT